MEVETETGGVGPSSEDGIIRERGILEDFAKGSGLRRNVGDGRSGIDGGESAHVGAVGSGVGAIALDDYRDLSGPYPFGGRRPRRRWRPPDEVWPYFPEVVPAPAFGNGSEDG